MLRESAGLCPSFLNSWLHSSQVSASNVTSPLTLTPLLPSYKDHCIYFASIRTTQENVLHPKSLNLFTPVKSFLPYKITLPGSRS